MKRMAAWLIGGWAAWRLFGPEFSPRFTPPQRHPSRIGGRTVYFGDREFMVREAGDPASPTLFMLHGWGYDSIATWHRVVEPLADHFHVVMMDQRNHGGSSRERGPYSIEDLADDAAGVMDALELRQVVVAGYSMGGMVAQALARRHPGKASRLVLGATAARPIDEWRRSIRLALLLGRGVGRISTVEWARLTHRYLIGSESVDSRHARWLWTDLMGRDSRTALEAGIAVWHFDSRDWVGSLDVPALVIIPGADQLIRAQGQRRLAALLPDATVVELPGARHEAVLTHAGEIAKAIVEFAG